MTKSTESHSRVVGIMDEVQRKLVEVGSHKVSSAAVTLWQNDKSCSVMTSVA